MGEYTGLSHCKLALAFAVLMDVVGGAALLVGVFANLKIQDRDLGDVLVYSGMLVKHSVKNTAALKLLSGICLIMNQILVQRLAMFHNSICE
uniref:Uncharacterized protein n=1 Tax=Neolamprologus brichardi TaxID=32507 RepID=A0A3Q4GCU9_NEOBR